jgi:putative nucleotidyltransferase with HDIG domain
LVDIISSHKPKAIALDVSFVGKSGYGEADDAALLKSLSAGAGRIVLASYIGTDGIVVLPLEDFRNSGVETGFVNKIKDENSVVRSARALAVEDNSITYSSEVKSVCLYKDIPLKSLKIAGRKIILGPMHIRLNLDGTFPIKYDAKPNNFDVIPVSDIFAGNFNSSLIKGRLVMIGMTAEVFHDIYLTPLGYMPGVFISAATIDNILSENIAYKLNAAYAFIFLTAVSLLSAYSGLIYPFIISFIIAGLASCGSYAAAILAFRENIAADAFGAIMLIYANLLIARSYLYMKSHLEKMRLLNLLTADEKTGLYNIYYLVMKLQRLLEAAKDKRDYPVLALLGFIGKEKALPAADNETQKDILKGIVSIIKEKARFLNAVIAYTGDFEFGIALPRYKRERFEQWLNALYQRIDGLELISSKENQRYKLAPFIGACYGAELEAGSAKLMIYACQQALAKAKAAADKKISFFDPKEQRLGVAGEKDKIGETEARLIDFIIEDLKQKNREFGEKISKLNQQVLDLKGSYLTVISSLVKALEEKDVYTAGHSKRVADYSMALADKISMDESLKQTLMKAALLHDIGKIGMPDAVLHKKGELSEDDKNIIKKHEIDSVRILEPAAFLKDTLPMILHHHEHFDGSGYPHGLAGERIPLGARIIAITDTFDAMTSGRGYNRPLNTDEVVAALRQIAGKQLDPALVEKFIEVIKTPSASHS